MQHMFLPFDQVAYAMQIWAEAVGKSVTLLATRKVYP